jgi:hypothetical protein
MNDDRPHFEVLLRAALGGGAAPPAEPAVESCDLSDEQLAVMMETTKFDEHAARCAPCDERLAMLRATFEEAILPDPMTRRRLVQGAKELRQEREGLLSIALRWAKGAFEVLAGADALVPTPAVAMRSLAAEAEHEPVSFRKSMGALDVVVHVTPRTERFDILLDTEGTAVAQNRFTLFRGSKELHSELSRGERVRFADVPAGSYTIAVDSGGTFVGEIALTVSR